MMVLQYPMNIEISTEMTKQPPSSNRNTAVREYLEIRPTVETR